MVFWITFIHFSSGCENPYTVSKKGLSVRKLFELCMFGSKRLCERVPSPQRDVYYVINLKEINVTDLTSDTSGSYDSHSCPLDVVRAVIDSKIQRISHFQHVARKRLDISCNNLYHLRRQYSYKKHKNTLLGKRIITTLTHDGGSMPYAVIQYLGNVMCSRPHGNSKKIREPYMRTKRSTLRKIAELGKHNLRPKQIISHIDSKNGGPLISSSPNSIPRDRIQVYNILKKNENKIKARNTGQCKELDITNLLCLLHLGNFLLDVTFGARGKAGSVQPLTFAMSPSGRDSLQKYCTVGAEDQSVAQIDMTYKVGLYYTTFVSLKHPAVVQAKNKRIPTVLVAMMTSTTRQRQDYEYLAHSLKKCANLSSLVYGTDGEYALEQGFESVFPIDGKQNIHLRCFNHVQDDLKRELKGLNVTQDEINAILKQILGHEFQGKRNKGLVDYGKDEFIAMYDLVSCKWPAKFREYMESTSLRVRSLKDSLLQTMGAAVRTAAGLGDPPNKYTQQRAECINNTVKEALDQQKLDQATLHEKVLDNVIVPQDAEFAKSLFPHGEFRLAEKLRKHQVVPQKWASMSQDLKHCLVSKVFGRGINIRKTANVSQLVPRKLSRQPQDFQEVLSFLPTNFVRDIWLRAEEIFGNNGARVLENGNVCVADVDDAYLVKMDGTKFSNIKCQCNLYSKLKLCGHLLVACEVKGLLEDALKQYKISGNKLLKHTRPSSAGEKKNKKPRRGKQNISLSAVEETEELRLDDAEEIPDNIYCGKPRPFRGYSEIFHNDHPFVAVPNKEIEFRSKLPICASCLCQIPIKNAQIPNDFVLCHKERYTYPKRNDDGTITKTPTVKKMTTKFYCVRKACVLKRHPYFWAGLIEIKDIERFGIARVEILKRNLDFLDSFLQNQ